ncbi:hypothetical protein GE107_15120 [Cohnella sp. CFH 77786]|nr:hypothetical protein [Cohnella sp. CFH 77786]MBW5447387.1 hypothetical protein [Cohnella sp. CFH 77786]
MMRSWDGIVLIVLAFLALMAGQAGAAAGETGKLAPPLLEDVGTVTDMR